MSITVRPYYNVQCNITKMSLHKNLLKCTKWKWSKMHKIRNHKMCKTKKRVKILRLLGGVHFSALKPGPVVPPGTQKVPDQAARNSQSVDFGHLSDILAILRGGHFFHYFWSFLTFSFYHFFHFLTFLILSLFVFLCFSRFCTFSVLLIFVNFCHFFIVDIDLCHFLSLNYVPQLWHTFRLAKVHSHYPPFW